MTGINGRILTKGDFKVNNDGVYVNNINTPGMLLIWGDFCSHCHRFLPTFNELCDDLGSDFICSSIESEEITNDLRTALNFKGFPTIKFFDQNGKIIGEYSGSRNKENILEYICDVYHHCYKYH